MTIDFCNVTFPYLYGAKVADWLVCMCNELRDRLGTDDEITVLQQKELRCVDMFQETRE